MSREAIRISVASYCRVSRGLQSYHRYVPYSSQVHLCLSHPLPEQDSCPTPTLGGDVVTLPQPVHASADANRRRTKTSHPYRTDRSKSYPYRAPLTVPQRRQRNTVRNVILVGPRHRTPLADRHLRGPKGEIIDPHLRRVVRSTPPSEQSGRQAEIPRRIGMRMIGPPQPASGVSTIASGDDVDLCHCEFRAGRPPTRPGGNCHCEERGDAAPPARSASSKRLPRRFAPRNDSPS